MPNGLVATSRARVRVRTSFDADLAGRLLSTRHPNRERDDRPEGDLARFLTTKRTASELPVGRQW